MLFTSKLVLPHFSELMKLCAKAAGQKNCYARTCVAKNYLSEVAFIDIIQFILDCT
jgi:hypothetical protein